MLVVLMALIEMGRMRLLKVTRWLWLALSGGLVSSGCDISSESAVTETTDAAPDSLDVLDGVDAGVEALDVSLIEASDLQTSDVDANEVLPDLPKDCEPMVAYGPPPCESDDDCEKWFGAGWICDKSAVVNNGCEQYVYPSCIPGQVDVFETADIRPDCEPSVDYGPPPCQSDEECRQQYGANWYCDKENQMDLGCGLVPYPLCREQSMDAVEPDTPVDTPPDCPIVVYYGPPPPYGVPVCTTDQDCIEKGYPKGTKCVIDPCYPYQNQCVPPK